MGSDVTRGLASTSWSAVTTAGAAGRADSTRLARLPPKRLGLSDRGRRGPVAPLVVAPKRCTKAPRAPLLVALWSLESADKYRNR